MTGSRGAIPIQAPHLLKALIRQDTNVVALPAPRRRPPRAGLRQRRLPHAALQPVRLLRGRADPRVTARRVPRRGRRRRSTYDATRSAALARSRPVRDPARAGADAGAASRARRPAAGVRGALVGGHERQGQRAGAGRQRPAGRRAARRRDAEAAPRVVSGALADRRPADRGRRLRAAASRRVLAAADRSRGGSGRRPSSSC